MVTSLANEGFTRGNMQNIILKTNNYPEAEYLLKQALNTEIARLKCSLDVAVKKLKRFEMKYGISSETFIQEYAAEDMDQKDFEYIEWAGEFEFSVKLRDRISTLEGLEYANS